MKRPWYYRMLLSYLPVFFIISSFLFFLFFQEINAQSRQDAKRANEVLLQTVIDNVENSLESLDYALAHFSIYDPTLYQFLQGKGISNVTLNTKMLKEIAEFKRQNPLFDSIYLVRTQDETVLSEKYIFPMQEFPDYAYIKYLRKDRRSLQWSSPRAYIDFNKTSNVITLAKYVYLSNGEPCIVVANVKTESIQLLAEKILNPGTSFIKVENSSGKPIFEKTTDTSGHPTILSEGDSAYLGWKFQSGVKNGEWVSVISTLSSLWMVLGIVTVVLGIVSIIYITRKNYEPLENVISSLRSLAGDKKDDNDVGKGNEFAVIQSAISNMLKRNKLLEKQRDGEGLRKKHFIVQLLEGTHRFGREEWLDELKGYHLPINHEGIFVIQAEIDQYAEFVQTFSKQDQWLLKYAITNVFSEIFQKFNFSMLSEWTADRRLSYILFGSDIPPAAKEKLMQASEEVLDWVKEQLPLSVTVGIGSYVRLADEIQVSYRVAQIALKSKMVRGTGSVIYAETVISRPRTDLFKHLQAIHGMVSLYRLGDEEWSKRFFEWFDGIRSNDLLSDDIVDLLQYFIFQLDRALGELGPEFREPWQQRGMQSLTDILDKEETLTAIMNRFFNVLSRIGEEVHLSKETKGHYEILQAVREYIEHHYTDAGLSLDRLSDTFHVNPKYLSQLFKENFGEGFMEFLTHLRIEQAKTLLLQSKDPIQAISGKVGYANNVSFMRSFKKMTGQSPGDFRKNSKSGRNIDEYGATNTRDV